MFLWRCCYAILPKLWLLHVSLDMYRRTKLYFNWKQKQSVSYGTFKQNRELKSPEHTKTLGQRGGWLAIFIKQGVCHETQELLEVHHSCLSPPDAVPQCQCRKRCLAELWRLECCEEPQPWLR